MTKTERILLAVTAAFFLAACFLLPREGGAGRAVEPAYEAPGPSPAAEAPDELWITLQKRIDLNHASAQELTALPGVGPVLAEAIVSYREENGPFARLEDLLLVSGFGPGTLEAVRAAAGE